MRVLPKDLHWHMIGHLQTEQESRYVVDRESCMIHSVDSLRLAEADQRRG